MYGGTPQQKFVSQYKAPEKFGRIKWWFGFDTSYHKRISSLVVHPTKPYLYATTGYIINELNYLTGEMVSHFLLSTYSDGALAITEQSVLYAITNQTVVAVDFVKKKKLWETMIDPTGIDNTAPLFLTRNGDILVSAFKNKDSSRNGYIHKLNKDGIIQWNFTVVGKKDSEISYGQILCFAESPLNEDIYFTTNFHSNGLGPYPSVLFSLNKDGKLNWKTGIQNAYTYDGIICPQVDDNGTIILGCMRCNSRAIYTYHPNGTEKWITRQLYGATDTVSVMSNNIIAPFVYNVTSIDKETGEVLWGVGVPADNQVVGQSVVSDNGLVIISTLDYDHNFGRGHTLIMNISDGKIMDSINHQLNIPIIPKDGVLIFYQSGQLSGVEGTILCFGE